MCSTLMDEFRLENPKASGTETLKAFGVFSDEAYLGLHTACFVILELVLFALYILVPELETDAEDLGSDFAASRLAVLYSGCYVALYRLWGLFKRSCRLNRIRLSIWERELKLYRVKHWTAAAAIIAPCVAAAIWVALYVRPFF